MSSNAAVDGERRFELLMLDYEMAREDDRTSTNAQATMFGIAVALVAIMIPLLGQTCGFYSEDSSSNCVSVPKWFVAATPMAPLALVGFLSGIGTVATIRSYYLRALETELQRYSDQPLARLPIPPLSLMGLSTTIVSLRRGRRGYRLLYFLLLTATLAVFGAITWYIVWKLPPLERVVSALVYSAGVLIIVVEVMRASIGGRALFAEAIRGYVVRRANVPEVLVAPPVKERGLIGYLLLPRPQDVIKWTFVPPPSLRPYGQRNPTPRAGTSMSLPTWCATSVQPPPGRPELIC